MLGEPFWPCLRLRLGGTRNCEMLVLCVTFADAPVCFGSAHPHTSTDTPMIYDDDEFHNIYFIHNIF